MTINLFLFYAFASVLVIAALGVISVKNSVHAALLLVLTFFTCAALWLLMQAEFLAIALVLVYVGAVMVLFLFVVMMLDINLDELRHGFTRFAWLGWLTALAVLLLLYVRRSGSVFTAAAAGLSLGAAVLTRANLAPFALIAPLWLGLAGGSQSLPWQGRIRVAILCAGVGMLIVAPWLIRAYQLTGSITLSTQSGFFLWLDVSAHGGDEAATRALWREGGLRVIPGHYLARDGSDGRNPGEGLRHRIDSRCFFGNSSLAVSNCDQKNARSAPEYGRPLRVAGASSAATFKHIIPRIALGRSSRPRLSGLTSTRPGSGRL